MENTKFKVGDKVKIKWLSFYNSDPITMRSLNTEHMISKIKPDHTFCGRLFPYFVKGVKDHLVSFCEEELELVEEKSLGAIKGEQCVKTVEQSMKEILIEGGQTEGLKTPNAHAVFNTNIETKQEFFSKFAEMISNQFKHGGDKYKLQGFNDREATDIISSIFGGASEFDWILGTMVKYIFRFKNFNREKDLLKIATYCYILWLKQGNHLKIEHDEDTNVK